MLYFVELGFFLIIIGKNSLSGAAIVDFIGILLIMRVGRLMLDGYTLGLEVLD